MRKNLVLMVVTCIITGYSYQPSVISNYEEDFIAAANSDLHEEELNQFFQKYDNLIFPQQGTTQLMNRLKGIETEYNPLIPFKSRDAYKENIEKLLHSNNPLNPDLCQLV